MWFWVSFHSQSRIGKRIMVVQEARIALAQKLSHTNKRRVLLRRGTL